MVTSIIWCLVMVTGIRIFWYRVLRKIQLHFNIDELREIDDDTIDDDVSLCVVTHTPHIKV